MALRRDVLHELTRRRLELDGLAGPDVRPIDANQWLHRPLSGYPQGPRGPRRLRFTALVNGAPRRAPSTS